MSCIFDGKEIDVDDCFCLNYLISINIHVYPCDAFVRRSVRMFSSCEDLENFANVNHCRVSSIAL